MKLVKYFLIALTLFVLACQNKTADKNMQDDAILMEDAKVESDKPDTTNFEYNDADTLRNQ